MDTTGVGLFEVVMFMLLLPAQQHEQGLQSVLSAVLCPQYAMVDAIYGMTAQACSIVM
jgi:hypothetical protein